MSKKRPTQAEARWRAHHRYLRERALWLAEEADGDPLGFAEELRKRGILTKLQLAIMATTRRRNTDTN